MRLEKIDLLRGFSVIGMMFFHANYMLENVFQKDSIPLPDSFWSILGPTVAVSFMVLSGFSYFLASRAKSSVYIIKKSLYRALQLGSIAFLITLVTFIFIPSERISWGIIHFFALSALLFPLFSFAGKYTIVLWLLILCIGYFFGDIWVSTYLLIPWGWVPAWYFSADYYPIFPWFGYALIGHGGAYFLDRYSQLWFLKNGWGKFFRPIQYIWRYALWFYVGHVPILFILSRFFSFSLHL